MCDLDAHPVKMEAPQQLREVPLPTKSTHNKENGQDRLSPLHVLSLARRNVQDVNPNVP